MSRKVLQRNQAFLDKVISENEKLVQVYNTMNQDLAEINEQIAQCKAVTLKQVEPRIQKLLDTHKINLDKQKALYESEIKQLRVNLPSTFEIMKQETQLKIESMKEDCKSKLKTLKASILAKEKSLKEDLAAKISQVPALMEQEKEKRRKELADIRSQWQQSRVEILREEYQTKVKHDAKRAKHRQDKLLNEVVSKLQIDAHAGTRELESKLIQLQQDHRKVEQDLQSQVSSLESEIKQIRQHKLLKANELEDLRDKADHCQCRSLRIQVETSKNRLQELEVELQQQNYFKDDSEKQLNDKNTKFNMNLEQIEEQNEKLRKQVEQSQQELNKLDELSKKQIEELEKKQKNDLALLSNRVKQTIEKKDALIQQLMNLIEEKANDSF